MEVSVAVGRDMGEFPADGAVLDSDLDVRYRTLVVRGSQLANGEVLDASTKLQNGKNRAKAPTCNGRAGCGVEVNGS